MGGWGLSLSPPAPKPVTQGKDLEPVPPAPGKCAVMPKKPQNTPIFPFRDPEFKVPIPSLRDDGFVPQPARG